MGQAKPVDDQPSMDEILESIRRIIDRTAEQEAPPAPANDPLMVADDPPARDPDPVVAVSPQARPPLSEADLDRFTQAIDARVADESADDDAWARNEVAKHDNPPPRERASKYEARFTEDDSRAFQTVATVLSASAVEKEASESAFERLDLTSQIAPAGLISETARGQIGASFDALSDTLRAHNGRDLEEMAEDILRPMLSEWLDNNLPAIVERLVRAEIEAIARGAPRQS